MALLLHATCRNGADHGTDLGHVGMSKTRHRRAWPPTTTGLPCPWPRARPSPRRRAQARLAGDIQPTSRTPPRRSAAHDGCEAQDRQRDSRLMERLHGARRLRRCSAGCPRSSRGAVADWGSLARRGHRPGPTIDASTRPWRPPDGTACARPRRSSADARGRLMRHPSRGHMDLRRVLARQ